MSRMDKSDKRGGMNGLIAEIVEELAALEEEDAERNTFLKKILQTLV